MRLLESITDPTDLRQWISVAVRSVTEYPTISPLDSTMTPSLRALHEGFKKCSSHLPKQARTTRLSMTRHLITQTVADHERLLAEAPEATVSSWESVAEELINTILAIWSQPSTPETPPLPNAEMIAFARHMRDDFTRFMMEHQFAVDEILTKVTILRKEFLHLQRYNPIENVSSRVKSIPSILNKVTRRNIEPSLDNIRKEITDIAGIRIICSFIADTYQVLEALTSQDDVRVLEVQDYIASPKPNGYKSLHALIEIPVYLSTGPVPIIVEVQIRTIAMDFWASLEHKIFYKYEGSVPARTAQDLKHTADLAANLDRKMEELHNEVHGPDATNDVESYHGEIDDTLIKRFWELSQKHAAKE